MVRKGELFEAFRSLNYSKGLQLTCIYLKESKTALLEEEWITMTSFIGRHNIGESSGLICNAWQETNYELWDLVRGDVIDVKNALVVTTKLFMIMKRLNDLDIIEKELKSLTELRSLILEYFPSDVHETPEIVERYMKILPNKNNEELYNFCIRVLNGLENLVRNSQWFELSLALEYFCRKKYTIPLVKIFPAINEMEAKFGDTHWFMWGFFLCVFSPKNNNKNIATNFSLFKWKWKRSGKFDRLGLLAGTAFTADNKNVIKTSDMRTMITKALDIPVWTSQESSIIDNVSFMYKDLWLQLFVDDSDEEEHLIEETVKFEDIEFMPRIKEDEHNKYPYLSNYVPETKEVIYTSSKKSSHHKFD